MALLTKEEALKYLQDILHIQVFDVTNLSDKSTPVSTKLSFLESLLRAFLEQEPFQSIYLMSHDINSRRRPTWDEIKRDMLLGRGGLCYWQNAFMFSLLTALDLNASMTFATFDVGIYCPNNHVIVLIHDLVTPGSLHLVDTGFGYYIPRAVSLDFTGESPEYTDSFMTYKFLKESENLMYLLKKVEADAHTPVSSSTVKHLHESQQGVYTNQEDNTNGASKSLKNMQEVQPSTDKVSQVGETKSSETIQIFTWKKMFFFNPLVAIKELEPFFPCFDIIFSDITKLSTHSSPKAMCWPNGRFLALVNSKLIQEVEGGKLIKTSIVETVFRPSLLLSSQNCSIPSDTTKHGTSNEQQDDAQELKNNSLGETVTKLKIKDDKETINCKQDRKTNSLNGIVTDSRRKDDNEAEKSPKGESQNQLLDLEPLVKAYEEYFPRLPPQMVRAALRNWLLTGTIFPVAQHLN